MMQEQIIIKGITHEALMELLQLTLDAAFCSHCGNIVIDPTRFHTLAYCGNCATIGLKEIINTIETNLDNIEQFELCRVRDLLKEEEGDDTMCEVDNLNPQFYSIYYRDTQGEANLLADFEALNKACQMLNAIEGKYKKPCVNFVPIKQQIE